MSPFEVEQALISHPSVLEAAVVAHQDEEGLVKPKAYVVFNTGFCDESEFRNLKNHVKEAIGVWKYPRWIVAVDDLPKTASVKSQRDRLRDREAEHSG